MKEKAFLKDLLIREVLPATGCTEVGAVALATGWAVLALGSSPDEIKGITVEVDDGTCQVGFIAHSVMVSWMCSHCK